MSFGRCGIGCILPFVLLCPSIFQQSSLLPTTQAHVIWVHPAPRPSTDVKNYPCGAGSVWDVGPITDLQVGPNNEVIFDEFVCHAGDMVRIAISMHKDDGYDNHVLLDRLPHNDLCNRRLDHNLMAVNITIPNVDCVNNECSLQVIQVMASKFPEGGTCENPGGIAQQCGNRGWMYYSCARVRIPGALSEIPRQFVDFYGAAAPVAYEWPLVTHWNQDATTDIWRLRDGWTDPTAAAAVAIEPPSQQQSPSTPLELNVVDPTTTTPQAAENNAAPSEQASKSTRTTGIRTVILACCTMAWIWA